jgi:hypothetical protein
MFATFHCAFFANFCADATNILCFAAAQAHEFRCGVTNRRTFHIELNAAGHHLNVFFLRTRACAIITNGCTAQTGFYTGLVLLVTTFHNLIF